jgi:hypothetical protein
MNHLRSTEQREWESFPQIAERAQLVVSFDAERNPSQQTLRLRQHDVKQLWKVWLRDQVIGELQRDENPMVVYFPIPAGALQAGENTLRIEQDAAGRLVPDDIRVGHLTIDARRIDEVMSEAKVQITVINADNGRPTPARITIVDHHGDMQTLAASSSDDLAVRPGTIYTSSGAAEFGLPAGQYTVYAGRGFEYAIAQEQVTARAGETVTISLAIRREVPTDGYVACDTHVHSLTHSGHGDATVEERMITLAGEGIELPIATDHNVHIDHDPFAQKMNVRSLFTPVIGNEVTTGVGHFNVFPIKPGSRTADHTRADWPSIFDQIEGTPGVRVIILNHPRDLHSGVRPFGPKRYNWLVAENLNDWPLRFNGVEVINSSATQNDIMRPFRDWMALLNRGYAITPVGSSDSHDVARHFVGQGRTYIRCDDRDPGQIDVDQAVASFLKGSVLVSYGLLTEIVVDDRYRSGDIAPAAGDSVQIQLRVLGPTWTKAHSIELFVNGSKQLESPIPKRDPASPRGLIWEATWTIAKPKQDVHLVAIARGPGIDQVYWKTAKPYQATSISWTPEVIGCSGAVWLDADGDGKTSCARDYAEQAFAQSSGNLAQLIQLLSEYDEATAAHAAQLYWTRVAPPPFTELSTALDDAREQVRTGFQAYYTSWRENQQAQASASE